MQTYREHNFDLLPEFINDCQMILDGLEQGSTYIHLSLTINRPIFSMLLSHPSA